MPFVECTYTHTTLDVLQIGCVMGAWVSSQVEPVSMQMYPLPLQWASLDSTVWVGVPGPASQSHSFSNSSMSSVQKELGWNCSDNQEWLRQWASIYRKRLSAFRFPDPLCPNGGQHPVHGADTFSPALLLLGLWWSSRETRNSPHSD